MRIIIYYWQNGYLYSSNSGKSQDALKMIIEDSSYNDLGNEPTIQSFYHLDHAVANICKGFTEQEIRRLWIHSTDSEDKVEHGRVWKKIDDINYEFKYFPKTLFTVEKKAGDYPFAIVSDMTQYMVTKIDPDLKDGEIYGRLSIAEQIARSVYNSLIKLGLSPKSLVSPITAYKDIIKAMNLPTWQDVPDEANQYYYNTCTGGWIETFKTGHFDKVYTYDLKSAYPSKMRNLVDFRKGTWEKVDSVPDHKAGMLGVFNCTAEMEADLHCIVYRDEREYNFNPNGTYDTLITWNKLMYADFHEWGKFHVKDGWVWTPKDGVVCYPLRKKMDELFELRNKAENDIDRKVIKRIMCFAPDTDIWTSEGIKRVSDVDINDLVYSINPHNGDVTLKPVTATFKYDYNGEMNLLKNKSYNFLITPEHKLLLRKNGRYDYEFVTVADMYKYKDMAWSFPKYKAIRGVKPKYISIWDYVDDEDLINVQPNKKWASTFEGKKDFRFIGNGHGYITKKKYIKNSPMVFEKKYDCKLYVKNTGITGCSLPYSFKTDDFLELVGWYVSEGGLHLYNSKYKNTNPVYSVNIVQKQIDEIENLVNRLNLPCCKTYCKHSGAWEISITHKALYKYLESKVGKGSGNKFLSDEYFKLDHTHLKHLFKTMMAGDGSFRKDRQMDKYTTVSESLANDFQRLCIHLGIKSRVIKEICKNTGGMLRGRKVEGRGYIYRVYIYKPNRTRGTRRKYISQQPYKGEVFCITVKDNHTVLAGRCGKFEFIGQSGIEGKMGERIFFERNGKMSPTTLGEIFNPCWRSEVENNTHLSVVNFCIENNIKPIAIMTDGVVTDVDLKIPSSTAMGGWKLDSVTKGLVMGSGILALQGKHKEGDFSLNYDVLMEKIDPNSTEIVLEKDGFVSIGEACERNLFAKLGEYEVDKRVIKLNSDTKRIYPNEPANFGELLEHTYDSIPIDVSMIGG